MRNTPVLWYLFFVKEEGKKRKGRDSIKIKLEFVGVALRRIPPVKRSDKAEDVDLIQPVYVGEFPQVVRDAQQAILMQKGPPG